MTDPFEHNEHNKEHRNPAPEQEPEVQPVQIPQEQEYTVFYGHSARQPGNDQNSYHGTGVGRKESPFANSPYERMEQPAGTYRYQPQTQPPQKSKKEKKTRKFPWKPILSV